MENSAPLPAISTPPVKIRNSNDNLPTNLLPHRQFPHQYILPLPQTATHNLKLLYRYSNIPKFTMYRPPLPRQHHHRAQPFIHNIHVNNYSMVPPPLVPIQMPPPPMGFQMFPPPYYFYHQQPVLAPMLLKTPIPLIPLKLALMQHQITTLLNHNDLLMTYKIM